MINRSPHPESSYAIDISTTRQLVKNPRMWRDIVVWHTHPGGNVGPSDRDVQSRVPSLQYLVVSLPRGEAVRF